MRKHVLVLVSALVVVASLGSGRAWAQQKVEVQAAQGKPFGVGKLVIHLPKEARPATLPAGHSYVFDTQLTAAQVEDIAHLLLTEKDGRALYPVFGLLTDEKLDMGATTKPFIRYHLEQTHDQIVVCFLFRGQGPLELTVTDQRGKAKQEYKVTAKPADAQELHKQLLKGWWLSYGKMADQINSSDVYAPVVENYLVNMLGRRLGLGSPPTFSSWFHDRWYNETIGLLTGAESVRLAMQKDRLLATSDQVEKADQPLPKPAQVPSVTLPFAAADVKIEPIAMHVPAECFYIRCGSFPNFQWMRRMLDDWGSSGRNLVAVRGQDYGLKDRLERQLALRETVLSKLLGDKVVADVALIGTDTFVREGPAVGILFQAKDNKLLACQIAGQRKAAMKADKSAREQKVRIEGHDVSLLLTPEGGVRSFYAADGDYHLVTTSRAIVARFYQAGAGKGALGASGEFRYARTRMPLSANHTLFVYMSDAFFRQLVGPAYRVEMTRRMQSLADMELLELATLAAKAEGHKADSIEALVDSGFLPRSFNRRSDGSSLVLRDGKVTDSLRGGRGSFVPVPDAQITGLTRSEVEAYVQFAREYKNAWEKMDPVMVGVAHRAKDGIENVVLDVYIAPYAKSHYGTLDWFLGPSTKAHIAPLEGDLLAADIVMKKQFDSDEDEDGEHHGRISEKLHKVKDLLRASPHMFAAARDFDIPFHLQAGEVVPDDEKDTEKRIRGYIGQWGKAPSFWSIGSTDQERDKDGCFRLGSSDESNWGRKFDGFTVLSNQKALLMEVAPKLQFIEAPREAQLRIMARDLAGTKLSAFLSAMGYAHTRRVSAGTPCFAQAISQQLHVPPEQSLAAGERILSCRLVCPLGGTYKLDRDCARWVSTAWAAARLTGETAVPAGYVFPFLDLVRGAELEFSIGREYLITHIELKLKEQEKH